MAQNRVITIDNGGSELRYISNTDNSDVFKIDKHISMIDSEIFRIKDNVGIFDIIDITDASNKNIIGMYATGDGYYMYNGVDVVMNNQRQKSGTVAWYQQIILAIAIDAMSSIEQKKNQGVSFMDDEYVVFDYTVGVLIPVSEHSGDTDNTRVIRDNLSGFYNVEFPCIVGCNKIKININPKSIGILPEGAVAITNLVNQVNREQFTLILDIGHVSTDIAICKGTRLIGSTVFSSSFAGGTLIKVLESILRKYRVVLTQEQIVEVVNTYTLHIGNKKHNVSDDVIDAKHRFVVNYLKDEILKQIELAGISATNISYILPVGGVLSIKDPFTGKNDIMEDIIKECNLTDAIVISSGNSDFRSVNIKEAAKFVNKMQPREEDESDIESE